VQWPALITCSDHMLTICLLSDSEASCTFMGALQRGPSGQRRSRPRPPKILVGWATMHLVPPIFGLHVR